MQTELSAIVVRECHSLMTSSSIVIGHIHYDPYNTNFRLQFLRRLIDVPTESVNKHLEWILRMPYNVCWWNIIDNAQCVRKPTKKRKKNSFDGPS